MRRDVFLRRFNQLSDEAKDVVEELIVLLHKAETEPLPTAEIEAWEARARAAGAIADLLAEVGKQLRRNRLH